MLRKAKSTELDEIMLIIEDGRKFLRQQGINQWQHGSPSKETIEIMRTTPLYGLNVITTW